MFMKTVHSWKWMAGSLAWLGVQAAMAASLFYTDTLTLPPKFALAVAPVFIFFTILFLTSSGKQFIDQLDPKWLTAIHIIRVPVEIGLFLLFIHELIPEVMTFEGRNFDIIAGLTAPLILYFGYIKKKLSRSVLLFWNIACLALLINIVTHAILSVETTFQVFGLDQPNRAILYFPFIWLPAFIVPAVLFSHIVNIRQLILKKQP